MESSSLQRRQGLEEKVPELERTIQMVAVLQAKKVSTRGELRRSWDADPPLSPPQETGEPFDTTFELSDTLFARAEIEQVDEVYIWLGVRPSRRPPGCRAAPNER